MKTDPGIEFVPLPMGEFRFADGEPHAGELGVVMAYAVRHPTGVILFDTGFGFGNAELDAYYRLRARRIAAVLADADIAPDSIVAVVNCHLHVDHAGQNGRFPGIPIYVQSAEWEVAHTTDHTILDWIDAAGTDYRSIDGDHALVDGVRILSTPGHTPGHQSLAVEDEGGIRVLAGQAVYTAGEWAGDATAREGRSRAPDPAAYARSIERLRTLEPVEVRFGHDARVWRRPAAVSTRPAILPEPC